MSTEVESSKVFIQVLHQMKHANILFFIQANILKYTRTSCRKYCMCGHKHIVFHSLTEENFIPTYFLQVQNLNPLPRMPILASSNSAANKKYCVKNMDK